MQWLRVVARTWQCSQSGRRPDSVRCRCRCVCTSRKCPKPRATQPQHNSESYSRYLILTTKALGFQQVWVVTLQNKYIINGKSGCFTIKILRYSDAQLFCAALWFPVLELCDKRHHCSCPWKRFSQPPEKQMHHKYKGQSTSFEIRRIGSLLYLKTYWLPQVHTKKTNMMLRTQVHDWDQYSTARNG